ncbi:uclacyanin 1 [Canna indica]|uniref:Uclacyanin 1 n=1 Tax=Canna indica TaxID=4628 RepID=A0AAQ3KXX7_9LILI|nr:uclacyanin 1 [Canna indica]
MATSFSGHIGVLVLATLLLLSTENAGGAAQGTQHVVGDDHGWDLSSNVPAWSMNRIFRVGDNIWFAYSAAEESILELQTKEEFESCDLSNPIQMYTYGLDKVKLDEQGTRYFVSGKPNQCRKGLKLHVEVMPSAQPGERARPVSANLFKALAPESSDSIYCRASYLLLALIIFVFIPYLS